VPPWGDLDEGVEDPDDGLWTDGHSSYNGRNDRIPEKETLQLGTSLKLIEVYALVIAVAVEGGTYRKRKLRARFTLAGESYAIGITDPVQERKYLALEDGDHKIGGPVCVSASETLSGVLSINWWLESSHLESEVWLTGTVYNIGHSNQSFDSFLSSLRSNDVTAIADARSYPYSNANPQFDRESLASELQIRGIAYVFLGRELGARTTAKTCFVDGKVQYDLLARTSLLREGLERVRLGMQKFQIVLLCAEAEPLACHRTILVARRLREMEIPVKHILKGGDIENHEKALERLLILLEMNHHDMFLDHAGRIEEAYRRQGERIAYEAPGDEGKKQTQTTVRARRSSSPLVSPRNRQRTFSQLYKTPT